MKSLFKFSEICEFIKEGLIKKENMTEKQAEEFLSKFSAEAIIKLYSKILDDIFKKGGNRNVK